MPLTGAAPVAFVVTLNRAAAEAFYGDVLALPRQPDEPFAAVFDLAGVPLRLTQVEEHQPGSHPVLGWSVPDIESTVKALATRGVRCAIYEGMEQDELGIWTSPDGTSRVAFFADPDGNVLALSQG